MNIAVINSKGGVGKTTTIKRLADYLNGKKQKVIIIDLDVQKNITKQYECIETIDIMGEELRKIEKYLYVLSITDYDKLHDVIDNINIKYDYILFDCPTKFDEIVKGALKVTNKVIIPVVADSYSLEGIEILVSNIEEIKKENSKLEIAGIFLNKYKRTKINNEFYEYIRELLPKLVTKSIIKDRTAIIEDTFFDSKVKLKRTGVIEEFENLFKELKI